MRKLAFSIKGFNNRKILMDITHTNGESKGLIIFVHGFKGFKDWGTHSLVAEYFASRGYTFLKFNFSHNGTTIADPLQFVDLEAFGQNTFSMELFELNAVIDYCFSGKGFELPKRIMLLGHSKGGGISILQAARDSRVSHLITWAATINFSHLWKGQDIDEWRKSGVRYVENARTHQQMPQYVEILEDYEQNQKALNIEEKASQVEQPWLIVHGTEDKAVSINRAERLKQLQPQAQLLIVEGADHVFQARHPYKEPELPSMLRDVCQSCIQFLNENELKLK